MSVKVLGISCSPRVDGNSDTLLKESLRGAESAGASYEYLSLRDKHIAACVECNACYRTGACRVQDDYQPIFRKMIEADRLVFATPIFFMAVCAQGKLLIDRCQCLWARKYVLKQPLFSPPMPNRHALIIAVGGSRSQKMFECIQLTMKYYLDVLEMKCAGKLMFNRVDGYGEVKKHPNALPQAFEAGRRLALLGDEPEGSIVVS